MTIPGKIEIVPPDGFESRLRPKKVGLEISGGSRGGVGDHTPRLDWSFEGTLSYVRETADLPRREAIAALFEAAAAGDRDRIVEGLEKVAETLAAGT